MPTKPPWLTRNAASQAGQHGHPDHVRKNKAQPAAQSSDDKLVVRRFQELSDGSLESLDDDLEEDDIGILKSRIAALEADIQRLKSGNWSGHEKSFINQLLSAKDAAGGALSERLSLGKQSLKQSERLIANKYQGQIRIPVEKL
jgi:hypothetical protein